MPSPNINEARLMELYFRCREAKVALEKALVVADHYRCKDPKMDSGLRCDLKAALSSVEGTFDSYFPLDLQLVEDL